MSGSGRNGDSKGNWRKNLKRRDRDNAQQQNRTSQKSGGKKPGDFSSVNEVKFEKKRGELHERPKWTPPKPPEITLPTFYCAWCGNVIKDVSTAFCEPGTGKPVHFDCVKNRIVESEIFESGDTISYIGGGRFGIIHYNNPPDMKDFKIKKILEWENKDNPCEWRESISDYFVVT